MAAAFDADAAEFGAGGRPLLVVGGPRFDPAMAAELGVDKIFGKGTTPGDVASYLAYALAPEVSAGAPPEVAGASSLQAGARA
jgi:hypothetical protein